MDLFQFGKHVGQLATFLKQQIDCDKNSTTIPQVLSGFETPKNSHKRKCVSDYLGKIGRLTSNNQVFGLGCDAKNHRKNR